MATDARRSSSVSTSNDYFSSSLYDVLRKGQGNIFVSPISANILLTIMQAGAKGDTANEIEKALQISNPVSVYEEYHNLLQSLSNLRNINLDMANRVYLGEEYKVKDDFKNIIEDQFMAGVENLNFKTDVETARQNINNWVAQKTKSKVTDILKEGSINSDTGIVLVNALSFKGSWGNKFGGTTKPEPFNFTGGLVEEVPMMHVQNIFKYGDMDDLQSQVIEIPYADQEISMVVFLPKEQFGLPSLEEKLKDKDLSSIPSQLQDKELYVHFPKFKMGQTIDLKSALRQLGIDTMFTEKADFSGFLDDKPESGTAEAVQKTYLEVNEEGGGPKSGEENPETTPNFKVDHPFLFMLYQNEYSTPLFMGRITTMEGLELSV